MKTAIATIAAVSVFALAPSLAMAKTINSQLTQTQIDGYCSGAKSASGGSATFHLGNGRTVTGTVNCATTGQGSLSAANGADDNGTESGNDSDSSHED